MTRYNVLYGILVGSTADGGGRYSKRFSRTSGTAVTDALLSCLLANVSDSGRRPLFASVLCAYVLDTAFGEDIAALDPDNTYVAPVRADRRVADGDPELMHDMTGSPQSLRPVVRYLDQDIVDRLVAPQWIDYAAAACLQLLREAL